MVPKAILIVFDGTNDFQLQLPDRFLNETFANRHCRCKEKQRKE